MKRLLLLLAGLVLFSQNQVRAQSDKSLEERYPLRPEFLYQTQAVAPAIINQTDAQALQNGGDWLLTQQFADGSFPKTVGQGPFTDSQGTTGRGMLTAYYVVRDMDHYNSAVRTGDFLVNSYPRQFSDGDPDIFPLDPIFLEELTLITGDAKYADFLQANLWDKLNAGTYGENNDWDAEDWADNIPVFADYSDWTAMEPLYRSTVTIAAHYTDEIAIRDALMSSILDKLEDISSSDVSGDLTGLAGAILASAHTGIDLDPQSGRWASANSTQGLVNILLGYQRSGGDWPYDTSPRALRYVGDVSTTSWACKALKAWNAQTYATQISKGIVFIKSLQQPSGQILTNPGWPSNTETGVQVHADALITIGTDDGIMLDDLGASNNQAPTAANGNANTDEDTPANLQLTAHDDDNDPLSYSIVSNPTKGTLSGAAPNLTYTPHANLSGSDSFTFRVYDGRAYSNTATMTITINAVNDAPVANNQTVSTSVNTALAITLTASDVDNAALNYVLVTPPSHGTLSGAPPALTYTPFANYVGADDFTFKANDGQADGNVATVAITVSAVNPNTNLALNKPITASSTNNSYPATRAVDGNSGTYWRSGSVSSSTVAWLRVDLQTSQSLGRVVINWKSSYYAKRYQIQVSSDEVNWTAVHVDNSGNGGVDEITFAATTARYVRVYMTRNNKSTERINEFEVYAPGSLPRLIASEEESAVAVEGFELLENYPNPFNPATTIRFRLTEPAHAVLKIYNALGQEVAVLVDEQRAAGTHHIRFDARDLPSGTYFSVLQAGAEKRVSRLLLMK